MKKLQLLLLLLLCIAISTARAQSPKKITLEDLWITYTFYPEQADEMVPMNDGEHYLLQTDKYTIIKVSYKNAKQSDLVADKSMLTPAGQTGPLAIESFEMSTDENRLLLKTNSEPLYRHSEISSYYVLDLVTKKLIAVSETGKQRLAGFSPDGRKVAFIRDNNMFVKNLDDNSEIAITTDGKTNSIIYGTTDWVYEEEFSFTKAFTWSPDSKKLGFMRFDESNVKEYSMTMYGELYPEEYRYKYPVAGEANSLVSVLVCDLSQPGKAVLTGIDLGKETDIYIPRIQWTRDPATLAVFRMNRLQNKLEILLCNADGGQSKPFYTEENKYYIEITDNFRFLNDGKQFVIMSEAGGYSHIYLYNLEGKLIRQITSGNWDVFDIAGIDEARGEIYYYSGEISPLNRDLYRIKTDGTAKEKVFTQNGTWEASFSSNFEFITATWSDANHPPQTAIYNRKGKETEVMVRNEGLLDLMKEYNFTAKEFFTFTTSGNLSLNAYMIKPPDFDASKKYPVLMYVYGGPNSQTVLNGWDSFDLIWGEYLAQNGYLFVAVDGRGTGGRGEQFRKCTYMEMGKLETEDQIEAARYLGKLPYVDAARIGIWGWSFGGYETLLCLTRGADVFKAGIAVAPVTNWRNYDNIYTERYMRTPQENPKGYDDNAPTMHVKKFKGKLLIVHGGADDNVHMQNTMEFISAMVNANKQFDMMIYPNKNHGIYGGYTRYHLFKKMAEFIFRNL